MEEKLKKIMAKTLGVPVNDINEESSVHTMAAWDSLKHIHLILALQDAFGVRFEDEEIPTMVNYEMILITLKSRLE